VRKLAVQVARGELAPESIDEIAIERSLYTAGIPDPDLVIRTSGELRLSNFLLWQISYSELWVTDTFWPDFGKPEFLRAIQDYAQRKRRFGGVDPPP
jgi:undecaprenyl diphosphate synthase